MGGDNPMVRRFGVTAVAAVLVVLSGCADRERATVADSRLMFSGDSNFQRVAVNSTRELKVSLQNVGRSRLNILDIWVEDQDGAFRASFDHEGPHDLIPGGSCEVKLRFKPRRIGQFPAAFVVRSDSTSQPLLRIDLAGEGVDAKAVLGARRLDFGRIELGSSKERTLSLENPSDLVVSVTPTVVGADRDEFKLEPIELQPFETRELPIAFSPTRVGVKRAALAVRPCEGCVDEIVTLMGEGLDRAIVAEPPELDFGQVPMDREATLPVTLRNISTEPQEVVGLQLAEGTDPSFTHTAGETPVVLAGGESRDFAFRYSPGHMGNAQGEAIFGIGSTRNPELRVGMFGFGGAPELCVSPSVHVFKPKPVGAKVSVGVTVKNCGTSNAAPLTVTEIVVGPSQLNPVGGEDQFSVTEVTLPRTLNAGEELTFRVYYEPTVAGEHATTVGIRTNGFQGSVAKVDVSGSAFDHAPCRLAITPAAVDFGTVLPNHDAVLGVKVNNIGTDVCPVKNIEIADDGGGVFRMPGGDIPGVIVEAGYFFSFMVQFNAPQNGGTFSGTLKIEVSDPANPVIYVPLVAHSQESCVVAVPPYMDFGIVRPDCPAAPQKTQLVNQCATPVAISSISIGAGTTDGEFQIDGRPATPMTLQPGETTEVEVEYLGQVFGLNLSPLYVGVSGLSRPLLVPLIGESSSKGDRTDRFVQQDGTKVDVLFVVDNTGSMIEEHPKLVAAIPSFISAAQQKNVDLRVAVTTTGLDPAPNACPGGAQGGEAGRFFPVDGTRPRILTLGTPNLTQVLQQNVQVGQCAVVEQGFEALKRALSPPLVDSADDPRTPQVNDGNAGFLREEAALAVIFVGDEDDHSPDDVDDYIAWLRSLKGLNQPQRSVIYAIAPTAQTCGTAGGTGTRYADAAARTGGEVLNICAADYGPLLGQVASQAFSPTDTFALSGRPEPGSLRVLMNGVEQTSGWTYDGAKNQIVFSTQPPAGATIEAQYRRDCED